MEADRQPLSDIIGAIVDPELLLTIGELGYVRRISIDKGATTVELALPIRAWPTAAHLEAAITETLATAEPGPVTVSSVVMTDDERLALRNVLRGAMEVAHEGHHHNDPRPSILEPG